MLSNVIVALGALLCHIAVLSQCSAWAENQREEGATRVARRTKTSSNLLPEFASQIGNVTTVLGRDVRLVCTVDHLGQFQVAWLKEETKTIISIDTNVIIANYRIFLIPDEEERKWVLHIKDVQESDRGFYQCQVNTNPMRSISGYLEVVVPPTFDESQTSQVIETLEHTNVSIQCKANGHPKPSIVWRRDDGLPIRFYGNFKSSLDGGGSNSASPTTASGSSKNTSSLDDAMDKSMTQLTDIKSDKLVLNNVDRSMAGIYVCLASNTLSGQVVKKIPLYVKFAPTTSTQLKRIAVNPGDKLEIDCLIEASPRPDSFWSKRNRNELKVRSFASPDPARWQMPGRSIRPQILSDDEFLQLNHPHNQVRFKRVNQQQFDDKHHLGSDRISESIVVGVGAGVDDDPNTAQNNNNNPTIGASVVQQQQDTSEIKSFVTVKQTALNPYTYKLKLNIGKIQPNDYGLYSCISTNALGTSETHVLVTRPERANQNLDTSAVVAGHRSAEESTNHKDTNNQEVEPIYSPTIDSTRNRVVYDEKYLQAIKARQSKLISSGRTQQKLRSRQYYQERNSASKYATLGFPYICFVVAFILLLD